MEWTIGLMLVGAVAGAGAVAAIMFARRGALQSQAANAKARAEVLEGQLHERQREIDQLRQDLASINEAREAAQRQAAVLEEQLASQHRQFAEQKRLLEEAEKKLTTTFEAAGAKALHANNEQFIKLATKTFETLMVRASGDVEKKQQAIDSLIKPIKELLEKQNAAVAEIEKKREVAYKGLEEQIRHIASSHEKLSVETGRLVNALRRPEQRGRWGELQLRNAVELAGMTEHCDFDEQVTIWKGEAMQRPDMVVNLPGRGVIPVDAKVAIDAYLDAIESEDPQVKNECLRRHADHIERHYKSLAGKRYWEGFEKAHSPQLVVMFMPLESALVAALEHKPDLHSQAMQQHVLIATPTLLVALLRAVAYGWQQDALAENARDIANVGAELYGRIRKFANDLQSVGKNLSQATNAYNAAIGSLEARVLPAARKLHNMRVTNDDEIKTPNLVDLEVRPIVASELKSLPGPELDGMPGGPNAT